MYMPYLAPFVRLFLSASTLSANVWARVAQVFGIWRPPPGVDHVHVEEVMATPVEPRVGESKMKSKVKREAKRAIKRGKQRQQVNKETFGSDEEVLQDADVSWGIEDVASYANPNTMPSNATKSSSTRFGGPIPGSLFGTAYERGSPQSLLNHVVTGKGPYDD